MGGVNAGGHVGGERPYAVIVCVCWALYFFFVRVGDAGVHFEAAGAGGREGDGGDQLVRAAIEVAAEGCCAQHRPAGRGDTSAGGRGGVGDTDVASSSGARMKGTARFAYSCRPPLAPWLSLPPLPPPFASTFRYRQLSISVEPHQRHRDRPKSPGLVCPMEPIHVNVYIPCCLPQAQGTP